MASMFREILGFLDRLGMYDVILPFLLVFSVTFAILEKTKIFGTITIGKETYTRKNYNAIVAFSLGFMVIASTRLVAIINEGMANVAIIMVSFVAFMLAIGVFYGEEDNIFGDDGIKKFRPAIVGVTFFAVLMIMFNSIKAADGRSWLQIIYEFIADYWNSQVVGSVLLLLAIMALVRWITAPPKVKEEKKGENK
jgi:hypothetical protein